MSIGPNDVLYSIQLFWISLFTEAVLEYIGIDIYSKKSSASSSPSSC